MKKSHLFLSFFFLIQSAYSAETFCLAHRALGYGGIENSMEAFESATKANSYGVEFDIRHTKDGKTIVFHDNTLSRLAEGSNCPINTEIKNLTSQEIRENCLLKNGEPIPTFEEAIEVLSKYETKLFIEFKDKVITESDIEILKNAYSQRAEDLSILSFKKGLIEMVDAVKEKDDFFKQIKTIRLKKMSLFGKLKTDGVSTMLIQRSRVDKLKDMGKIVGVYTKNSEHSIKKFIKKGVDFITTNHPKLCNTIIESRK